MSSALEAGFVLDARLARDTAFVADWKLCRVLLMNDARFPWLILVPRRAQRSELDELTFADQELLLEETTRAMAALRSLGACDKLNVGALGNVVRQLHLHVVARRKDDAAWPGPVWGSGKTVAYTPAAREALVTRLRGAA